MDLDSTSLVSSQSSHGQFNSLFSSSVPSRMTAAISLILPMLVPMLAPMGGTLPRVASRSDQEGGTNGPKRAGHVDRRLEPHERGGGDATMYQAGLGVSQDGNRFFRALTYSYLVRDPTSCKLRWACLGMERKSYIYIYHIYILLHASETHIERHKCSCRLIHIPSIDWRCAEYKRQSLMV